MEGIPILSPKQVLFFAMFASSVFFLKYFEVSQSHHDILPLTTVHL